MKDDKIVIDGPGIYLTKKFSVVSIVREKHNNFRATFQNADKCLYNKYGKCISVPVFSDIFYKIDEHKKCDINCTSNGDIDQDNYDEKLESTIKIQNQLEREELEVRREIHMSVSIFKSVMENKLFKNMYKGGWKQYSSSWLFERMLVELSELYNAMLRYDNKDNYQQIIDECADVANFAMMLSDVVRNKYEKVAVKNEKDK